MSPRICSFDNILQTCDNFYYETRSKALKTKRCVFNLVANIFNCNRAHRQNTRNVPRNVVELIFKFYFTIDIKDKAEIFKVTLPRSLGESYLKTEVDFEIIFKFLRIEKTFFDLFGFPQGSFNFKRALLTVFQTDRTYLSNLGEFTCKTVRIIKKPIFSLAPIEFVAHHYQYPEVLSADQVEIPDPALAVRTQPERIKYLSRLYFGTSQTGLELIRVAESIPLQESRKVELTRSVLAVSYYHDRDAPLDPDLIGVWS